MEISKEDVQGGVLESRVGGSPQTQAELDHGYGWGAWPGAPCPSRGKPPALAGGVGESFPRSLWLPCILHITKCL